MASHIQTAECQRQKENLKRKYMRNFDLAEERKNVSEGVNDSKNILFVILNLKVKCF